MSLFSASPGMMANGMGPVMESVKHAMESISKIGDDVKATFKIPKEIDVFVAGSAVFNGTNYFETISALRNELP